jgi:hypothetical protein
VLGQRSLKRPHGPRIAWNPADHLCTAFRLRVNPGPMRVLSATIRAVPET